MVICNIIFFYSIDGKKNVYFHFNKTLFDFQNKNKEEKIWKKSEKSEKFPSVGLEKIIDHPKYFCRSQNMKNHKFKLRDTKHWKPSAFTHSLTSQF